MKRIIVFYGNDLCYNTLNIFAEELASGLSSNGFDVVLVNAYTDSESLKEEIIKQAEKGIDAADSQNTIRHTGTVHRHILCLFSTGLGLCILRGI